LANSIDLKKSQNLNNLMTQESADQSQSEEKVWDNYAMEMKEIKDLTLIVDSMRDRKDDVLAD